MNGSQWLRSVVVGLSLMAPFLVRGQASTDSELVGTYYGAATGHQFLHNGFNDPYVPEHFVSGMLFIFTLQYNSTGYHAGTIGSSVIFVNGRLRSLSGELVVPPFPTQRNRDLDFFFTADFVQVDERLPSNTECTPYTLFGTMPYGRYSAAYFQDAGNIPFQLIGTTAYYSWINRTQVGNVVVIAQDTEFSTPFDLECAKVSNSLYSRYVPRVKIRR